MRNILILLILTLGLIFTSLIKNETRLLEKELANQNDEINVLNSNLSEATLDLSYLTTPKNISFLAKNFLEEEFSFYKKNQIINLNEKEKNLFDLLASNNGDDSDKFVFKREINKNLDYRKSTEIERLSFEKEDRDLQTSNIKNILDTKKAKKWAGFQLIKAILGLPIMPVK